MCRRRRGVVVVVVVVVVVPRHQADRPKAGCWMKTPALIGTLRTIFLFGGGRSIGIPRPKKVPPPLGAGRDRDMEQTEGQGHRRGPRLRRDLPSGVHGDGVGRPIVNKRRRVGGKILVRVLNPRGIERTLLGATSNSR